VSAVLPIGPDAPPRRPSATAGPDVRRAGPAHLAAQLGAVRQLTLALFAGWEQALPALEVPLHPELNPPLWELGHVGALDAAAACCGDHARAAGATARRLPGPAARRRRR